MNCKFASLDCYAHVTWFWYSKIIDMDKKEVLSPSFLSFSVSLLTPSTRLCLRYRTIYRSSIYPSAYGNKWIKHGVKGWLCNIDFKTWSIHTHLWYHTAWLYTAQFCPSKKGFNIEVICLLNISLQTVSIRWIFHCHIWWRVEKHLH